MPRRSTLSLLSLKLIPLLLGATLSQQLHEYQQQLDPRRLSLQSEQLRSEPLWAAECRRFRAFDAGISEELLFWQETGITEELMASTIGNLSINGGRYRPVGLSVAVLQGKLYVAAESTIEMTERWFAANLMVWVNALKRITERWGPSVPDVEILLAADDEPTQDVADPNLWSQGPYWPVMRHCRSTQSADITIPTWHFYTFNASARFFSKTEQFAQDYPWETKQHVAFGAGLTYHRDMQLAENARHFDGKNSRDDWGNMLREKFAEYLHQDLKHPNIVMELDSPIETWGRYKMVIHIDGITCSSKIWQLLALGSVVLREQSNYVSFYDKLIHSFMHYVPFWRRRPHEILWAYDWVAANDDAARDVARAGQAFVREMLTMQGLECYWLMLLRRYSEMQRFTPGSGNRSVANRYYIPADEWLAAQAVLKPCSHPEGRCMDTARSLELLPRVDMYTARMGGSG